MSELSLVDLMPPDERMQLLSACRPCVQYGSSKKRPACDCTFPKCGRCRKTGKSCEYYVPGSNEPIKDVNAHYRQALILKVRFGEDVSAYTTARFIRDSDKRWDHEAEEEALRELAQSLRALPSASGTVAASAQLTQSTPAPSSVPCGSYEESKIDPLHGGDAGSSVIGDYEAAGLGKSQSPRADYHRDDTSPGLQEGRVPASFGHSNPNVPRTSSQHSSSAADPDGDMEQYLNFSTDEYGNVVLTHSQDVDRRFDSTGNSTPRHLEGGSSDSGQAGRDDGGRK